MDTAQLQDALVTLLTILVPKVVGALLLIIAAWIVSKWLGKKVRINIAKRLDPTIAGFFGSMVRYLILTFAVLGCFKLFGIETTSFVALLGAAGLAIGFALQGTLSNFSSGVMLLAFRPFNVGDVINAGGNTGKVHQIGLFTTELDTPDNRRITVPNGAIYGSTIENLTFHDTRRVDVSVGTDYGADISTAREVMLKAVSTVDGVLTSPEPTVVLTALGGSSIDWSVRVWAKTSDYWAVKDAATQTVKMALDAAEIGIPFPQLDVHLDGIALASK